MAWIMTMLRELYGLFVDDGLFAVAVLVWVAVMAFVPARLGLDPGWAALMLFAGLALILLESTIRRARR